MKRRDFLTRLTRSLLAISAVAASGLIFSGVSDNESENCPPDKDCKSCLKAGKCGLPVRNQKKSIEIAGPPVK